jgi:hypothetical protein
VFGIRIVDATMGWYVQRGQELKIERDRMREERLKKRERESEKKWGSEDEEDETREIAIRGAEEELNGHGYTLFWQFRARRLMKLNLTMQTNPSHAAVGSMYHRMPKQKLLGGYRWSVRPP